MMDRKAHWETVYGSKGEEEVSWFEESPSISLELIEATGAARMSAIIDIGGGASRLVDALLDRHYGDVTVLDIAQSALAKTKARLGDRADKVSWIATDITSWRPGRSYDVWHDRAVFHFLTAPADQRAYMGALNAGLRSGGCAIIGTFAPDGPDRCSGLPVQRHDQASLAQVLPAAFEIMDVRSHDHPTPWGAIQRFQFSTFRKR